MRKFKFRLESVLQLRKQQEDQKKREVGLLQGQINELQMQIMDMNRRVKDAAGQLKKQFATGNVDLEWVSRYHGFALAVERGIQYRLAKIGQIQKQLKDARVELAKASQQKKIVEKLRQKQQSQYDSQLRRAEARQEDEIGTRLYLHSLKAAAMPA